MLQPCLFWPEMAKCVLHSNWLPARFSLGGASAVPRPITSHRLPVGGPMPCREPQSAKNHRGPLPELRGGHRPLKNPGKTSSRVLLTPLFLSPPLSFRAPAGERPLQSSGRRQAVADKEAGGGTRETNAGSAGMGRRRGRGDPARPRRGERPL